MTETDISRTDNEQLLQLGIQAAKRGDKEGARRLLRQVWGRDKRNERAMMWMAKLSRTPEERRDWLVRILKVNPQNPAAKRAVQTMEHTRAAEENRLLVLFGAVAIVMLVIVVAVLVVALA